MQNGEEGSDSPAGKVGLPESLNVLWACLGFAVLLDLLGTFEGVGFAPAFQLEAQPVFFVGMAVTVTLTSMRTKLGPLLAGVIFWIPIVITLAEIVEARDVIPVGGDVVGIAELAVAVVGVLAAHNVFHKLSGGWIRAGRIRR